jgi:peptide/nickel transport system permease protein
MVNLGRDFMRTAPWMTIFPGAVIALLILSFNTIGDALRDQLDPRLRLTQQN